MPAFYLLCKRRDSGDDTTWLFVAKPRKGSRGLRTTERRGEAAWFGTRREAEERGDQLQQEYPEYEFRLVRV